MAQKNGLQLIRTPQPSDITTCVEKNRTFLNNGMFSTLNGFYSRFPEFFEGRLGAKVIVHPHTKSVPDVETIPVYLDRVLGERFPH